MTAPMTRRERLMATLRGEAVDRPAVSLYEIGGLRMDPTDPDPFNVYQDPSWRPLLELAERETDLIRLRSAVRAQSHVAWDRSSSQVAKSVRDELLQTESWEQDDCRHTRMTLRVAGRELTSPPPREGRRHALDRRTPVEGPGRSAGLSAVAGRVLRRADLGRAPAGGRAGTGRPRHRHGRHRRSAVCGRHAAEHAGLHDRGVHREPVVSPAAGEAGPAVAAADRAVAREFPGRLWRIYGPEYASEPYLPPRLFDEYVVRYVTPMVDAIHAHGGFARIHCHGRTRNLLDMIAGMGADAIDPLEPPPLGDVTLDEVRQRYGDRLVLFGNLEVADIERMEPAKFDTLVCRTLEQGTAGAGRGFVLMPTACPVGRQVSGRTLANYESIVRRAQSWRS